MEVAFQRLLRGYRSHSAIQAAGAAFGLAIAIVFACMLLAAPAKGQETAQGLLEEAKRLYAGPETPVTDLARIAQVLDQIVEEHPSSDLAVGVLLKDTVDGLDVAAIYRQLDASESVKSDQESVASPDQLAERVKEALFVADPSVCIREALTDVSGQDVFIGVRLDGGGRISGIPELRVPSAADPSTRSLFVDAVRALDSCAPFPEHLAGREVELSISANGNVTLRPIESRSGSPPYIPTESHPIDTPQKFAEGVPSTPATESELNLSRQDIRDLQARLLVLGFDPNGIDGVIGQGTRSAFSAWQAENGLEANGYLNRAMLAALKEASESPLASWLKVPDNATRYNPPAVEVGAKSLAGSWGWRTTCPGFGNRIHRFDGNMNMRYVGNGRLEGVSKTNGGLRGSAVVEIHGSNATTYIKYGVTYFRGNLRRTSTSPITFSGSGNYGCKAVIWKS